jgi:hypothetical protein
MPADIVKVENDSLLFAKEFRDIMRCHDVIPARQAKRRELPA